MKDLLAMHRVGICIVPRFYNIKMLLNHKHAYIVCLCIHEIYICRAMLKKFEDAEGVMMTST